MAKRGRPRKDPATRALEGDLSNRPPRSEQPDVDPTAGAMRMPTRLTVDEREVWKHLIDTFPAHHFSPADKHLLIAYCRTQARIDRLERHLHNDAPVKKRANGSLCRHPAVDMLESQYRTLMRLSGTLGLTRDKRVNRAAAAQPVIPTESDYDPDGDERSEFGSLLGLERNVRLV